MFHILHPSTECPRVRVNWTLQLAVLVLQCNRPRWRPECEICYLCFMLTSCCEDRFVHGQKWPARISLQRYPKSVTGKPGHAGMTWSVWCRTGWLLADDFLTCAVTAAQLWDVRVGNEQRLLHVCVFLHTRRVLYCSKYTWARKFVGHLFCDEWSC